MFVWDGENVLQETDQTGVTQAQFTDFPGYVGGLPSMHRGSASSFLGVDPQYNTRLLTSSAGTITDQTIYSSFGNEVYSSGTTANRFRFEGTYGYQKDTTFRLYVRARHLNPILGLFLSRAEFEELLQGEHPYGYAENNPVNRVDPLGLHSCKELTDCLSIQRPRCTCSGRHDSSLELMLCIFWQEDSWGPGNKGEGPGNCTKDCFEYLAGIQIGRKRRKKCDYLNKYKSYGDYIARATTCEKIWAAQDYLGCKGINHYGPPGYPVDKLLECEECIKSGNTNVAVTNDPDGYPCSVAPCCVRKVHK